MSNDNVVHLHQTPLRQDMIESVRKVLALAEGGKLSSLAVVAIQPDGTIDDILASPAEGGLLLVGALEAMKLYVLDMTMENS